MAIHNNDTNTYLKYQSLAKNWGNVIEGKNAQVNKLPPAREAAAPTEHPDLANIFDSSTSSNIPSV